MTREEKIQVITSLTEKFQSNQNFYIADTSGLTVAEINKFREMCFKQGVQYQVAKNTLIKKALENLDTDYSPLDEVLKGVSGIMFSEENANAPAKIIKSFKKENVDDRPTFKAASIDTDLYIGEDQLNALANLKSKQELIGEIITILQSPTKNVISALQSAENNLAGIVKTLQERE